LTRRGWVELTIKTIGTKCLLGDRRYDLGGGEGEGEGIGKKKHNWRRGCGVRTVASWLKMMIAAVSSSPSIDEIHLAIDMYGVISSAACRHVSPL
jgi:hypothetical protein